MDQLLQIIADEGLAVFLLLIVLSGTAYFGKWFISNYTTSLATQFAELLREISEVKGEVLESNNKLYSMISTLVGNQRKIGEDTNAIESSLNTLLKFINKNGK